MTPKRLAEIKAVSAYTCSPENEFINELNAEVERLKTVNAKLRTVLTHTINELVTTRRKNVELLRENNRIAKVECAGKRPDN